MATIYLFATGAIATTKQIKNIQDNSILIVQHGVKYRISGNPRNIEKINSTCGEGYNFTVRSGENAGPLDQLHGNERAELITLHPVTAQPENLIRPKQKYRISYGFMVPSGQKLSSRFTIVGQIHAIQDSDDIPSMPPILAFILQKSKIQNSFNLELHTRYDADRISRKFPATNINMIKPLKFDKWHSIDLIIEIDPFNSANIDLYINGIRELNLKNSSIGYNNYNPNNYWQYGIYRSQSVTALTVSYADMFQRKFSGQSAKFEC